MGSPPSGFVYIVEGDRVVIRHEGRLAATLRGAAAAKFLTDVERVEPQLLMARATGQYRHGNERRAGRRP